MLNMNTITDYNPEAHNFASSFVQKPRFSAVLYVFSPKEVSPQVIRPNIYNFNENLIDELVQDNDMRAACGPRGINRQNIQRAILPDATGINVNVNCFSEYWSFVLIIDTASSHSFSAHSTPGPGRRFMASGYFIGEPPVNVDTLQMTSPTPNENALMMFTHSSLMFNDANVIRPSFGYQSPVSVNTDVHQVNQMLACMSNQDVFLIDPGVLRANDIQISKTERIAVSGETAIKNLDDQSVMIPTRLDSPKHHLKQIVDVAESALAAEAGAQVSSPINEVGEIYGDPYTNYIQHFDRNIISTSKYTPFGIDTTRPTTLGYLGSMYPNLEILPIGIPYKSQYDIRPQNVVTPATVFSNMVASTVSTIAMNCNIAEIIFQYSTWGNRDSLSREEGAWQVHHLASLIGADVKQALTNFNQFKTYVETDLFPILRTARGHFELQVKFDIANETVIDLHFLDDRADGGFVETFNRLSGMLSPTVGTIGHVNHNKYELQKFLDCLSIKATGVGPYMQQNVIPEMAANQNIFDNAAPSLDIVNGNSYQHLNGLGNASATMPQVF